MSVLLVGVSSIQEDGGGGSCLVNVTRSAGEDRNAAWSPDSRLIAFDSSRDGATNIYVMHADGSAPIAVYERYLNTPDFNRLHVDRNWLARAHESLGELYDGQGDRENAALHFGLFAKLWADADDELQPRVQAAQRRLEEILAEHE